MYVLNKPRSNGLLTNRIIRSVGKTHEFHLENKMNKMKYASQWSYEFVSILVSSKYLDFAVN